MVGHQSLFRALSNTVACSSHISLTGLCHSQGAHRQWCKPLRSLCLPGHGRMHFDPQPLRMTEIPLSPHRKTPRHFFESWFLELYRQEVLGGGVPREPISLGHKMVFNTLPLGVSCAKLPEGQHVALPWELGREGLQPQQFISCQIVDTRSIFFPLYRAAPIQGLADTSA